MKKLLSVLFVVMLAVFHPATQAIEKQVKLSAKELRTLIETAKTPADHAKIERYYKQRAEALVAESKEHEAMAESYRKNPTIFESKSPMSGPDGRPL